jgi:hypothetical protein
VKFSSVHAALVAFVLLVPASRSFANTPDQTAIMVVMHGMFDKPNVELVIDPVVVEDGFAVADWIQGDMGGRAFLRKDAKKWTLVLCTGDEIRSTEALKASGVPAGTAERLASAIVEAEKGIPPDRLTKFASFQGVVRMDDQAHH